MGKETALLPSIQHVWAPQKKNSGGLKSISLFPPSVWGWWHIKTHFGLSDWYCKNKIILLPHLIPCIIYNLISVFFEPPLTKNNNIIFKVFEKVWENQTFSSLEQYGFIQWGKNVFSRQPIVQVFHLKGRERPVIFFIDIPWL